ncbi:myosin light chain 5 [Trichechus inunguis]
MDQNRDRFVDKEDLKDTYASLGKTNIKDDELDAMLKEALGPISFTMFLNLFGEKLNGTDAEETILNAFKMLDPEGKGSINKEYLKRLLMSQADKMTMEEVNQMFQFASIDAAGSLDYKAGRRRRNEGPTPRASPGLRPLNKRGPTNLRLHCLPGGGGSPGVRPLAAPSALPPAQGLEQDSSSQALETPVHSRLSHAGLAVLCLDTKVSCGPVALECTCVHTEVAPLAAATASALG